jgi:cell division ATPase FtsA
MSFPSRSFVSDLIVTQYSREDSATILNMQEIDQMIKRIEKASYERARTKSQKQFGIMSDDLKLISSSIVSIQIDGRNVSSPIGFSGSRVRLTVLNVFVPSGEFNIMRSIVSRLGKQIISLIPEPLILPKLIEETEAISDNTCLIDV